MTITSKPPICKVCKVDMVLHKDEHIFAWRCPTCGKLKPAKAKLVDK